MIAYPKNFAVKSLKCRYSIACLFIDDRVSGYQKSEMKLSDFLFINISYFSAEVQTICGSGWRHKAQERTRPVQGIKESQYSREPFPAWRCCFSSIFFQSERSTSDFLAEKGRQPLS